MLVKGVTLSKLFYNNALYYFKKRRGKSVLFLHCKVQIDVLQLLKPKERKWEQNKAATLEPNTHYKNDDCSQHRKLVLSAPDAVIIPHGLTKKNWNILSISFQSDSSAAGPVLLFHLSKRDLCKGVRISKSNVGFVGGCRGRTLVQELAHQITLKEEEEKKKRENRVQFSYLRVTQYDLINIMASLGLAYVWKLFSIDFLLPQRDQAE